MIWLPPMDTEEANEALRLESIAVVALIFRVPPEPIHTEPPAVVMPREPNNFRQVSLFVSP